MQSAPTHHRFFVILALFVAALISSTAQAQDIVYPGCDVPKINSGRIFYVDPINGSMAGDGSAAKPWRTLAEVANANLLSTKRYVANTTDKFTDNTKAKVKEGDTVLLMSGDHGSVTLKGFNTDFITIAAAPNQQPVLRELFLTGATRWKIEGLRFQGIKLASDWRSMVHAVGGFFGPATQLIIKDNYITSHDDVNYWSQIDWKNNARNGITIADTTNCTSLTNNKIINTRFGANLSGPNLVFHNNKIDYIGGDGLRFTNSNMLITHNRITNNLDLGDGNHPDAMQGFVCANGKCDGTAKNIVIDSNTIIRQTDPNLKFPNGLQGICAFDSNWYNVTVTNNVIVTNAYHGITMNGLHGGLIANNTVLGDGDLRPAINVKRAKTGVPSSDVTVRNNIAAGISIDDGLINVVPDHNLIFGTFSVPGPTKHMWYEKPGVYG
ncbi:MAG: right-handed parallel beta-helix repeat-containing protein, partial [Alphaproteobacteria bacterium]